MASVNSQSTRQQVLDAMADNASYDEDNSVVKARAFSTACTVWLTRWAFGTSANGVSTLSMPPEMVQAQLNAVRTWLASQPPQQPANGSGGNVVSLSIENFREGC